MRKAQFSATIRQDAFHHQKQVSKGKLLLSAALVLAMVSALSGVSLSPSALQFSTMKVGIGSELKKLKLSNHGRSDFRPERIEVKGPAAADFVVDRTTCAVVPSGQSCLLLVEYKPQLPGARHAQLVLASGDGKQFEAALSGTAVPATLKISPAVLNFNGIPPGGQSAAGRVTLASEGAFHIHRVSVQGHSDQFSEESDSCKNNSEGLKTCVISVRFEPHSEGNWSARLEIDDDAVGSPHIVHLSGVSLNAIVPAPTPISGQVANALSTPPITPVNTLSTEPVQSPPPLTTPTTRPVPPASHPQPDFRFPPVYLPPVRRPQPQRPIPTYPMIRVSPTSLDFSTNREQQVTITNYGSAPLEIGLSMIGQNPGRFLVNSAACPYSIAPGRSCNILVLYRSTQIVRQTTYYSAQLQITHNANNLATQYVSLRWQGIVVARPHLITKPTALDFSGFHQIVEMRTSAPATPHLVLTMVNDGQVALQQLNLRLGSSITGPFSHTGYCRQLSVGQACIESVFFSPRTRGNYSDKLYIFEGTQQLAMVDLKALMPAPPPPRSGNYGTDVSVLQKPSPEPKLGKVLQRPAAMNDATIFNNPPLHNPPSRLNSGIVKAGNRIRVPQIPPAGSKAGTLPKNADLVNRTTVSRLPTIQRNVPPAKVRTTQRVPTPPPPSPPR